MNKHIAYNFVLIFIIIKYVKSQDNNPEQPADEKEEGDEDNFDVLDLDKIIAERISRFDDPRYQPDYQQITESQYLPQMLIQPQQYDQLPSQQQLHYVQELLEPEQYGQYQPYQTQTSQPLTQPQQYDQYQPYVPPQPQPTQPSYQYYGPSQPAQPTYQYYITPSQPTQQPTYQYYGVSQPTQEFYQTYLPTQPQTEVSQPPQPQPQPEPEPQPIAQEFQQPEDDDNFYVTEHDQQHQGPSATDPGFLYGPTQPTTQPITQESTHYVPPQTQDQVAQQPTESVKRKRTQDSEDQGEGEEEDEEVSAKRKKPLLKLYDIKLLKNDSDGMLVEMTEEDYLIIFSDRAKTKLKFKADLEQIECEGDIIYVHSHGTPYCSGLAISRYTKIFILASIDEFILIKKTRGSWETTQKTIPDYVNIYTQDDEGNDFYFKIILQIRISPRHRMS
eukprot:XP_765535.1 hypothetical protein [Theileria parva strain Muguga]